MAAHVGDGRCFLLTQGRVPPVVARGPRQQRAARADDVVDAPGDDHVVVQRQQERYQRHTKANSWK